FGRCVPRFAGTLRKAPSSGRHPNVPIWVESSGQAAGTAVPPGPCAQLGQPREMAGLRGYLAPADWLRGGLVGAEHALSSSIAEPRAAGGATLAAGGTPPR